MTGTDGNLSAEGQDAGNIVGSSDGGAVAEGQALVQLDGHGVGAILILGFAVALHHGLVPDISAALVGLHGGVTGSQALDVLVRSASGAAAEAGPTEIAAQLSGAAEDGSVGNSGSSRGGFRSICFRRGSGRGRSVGSAAAGGQRGNHRQSQQQCQKLLHFFSSFENSFTHDIQSTFLRKYFRRKKRDIPLWAKEHE